MTFHSLVGSVFTKVNYDESCNSVLEKLDYTVKIKSKKTEDN